jgi:F0F1-type ATP synthase epsilon subunit
MSDEYTLPDADAAESAKSQAKHGMDDEDATMRIKIYSPYKVYFDGEAKSISAESATGPFDVLPKHHNFITLLEPCDAIIRTAKGEETVRISGGVMHVKADDLVIFLDV